MKAAAASIVLCAAIGAEAADVLKEAFWPAWQPVDPAVPRLRLIR